MLYCDKMHYNNSCNFFFSFIVWSTQLQYCESRGCRMAMVLPIYNKYIKYINNNDNNKYIESICLSGEKMFATGRNRFWRKLPNPCGSARPPAHSPNELALKLILTVLRIRIQPASCSSRSKYLFFSRSDP